MGMWTIPGAEARATELDQERIEFIRNTAAMIVSRGLEVPAVTLLEWGKPLASFWGAGLTVGAPFLGGLFGQGFADQLEAILGDQTQTEVLLRAIEDHRRQADSAPAEGARRN